jgi:hypothetical protein
MSVFLDRMIRASKMDGHLFEEVEADTRAMGQAMVVVILSSLAAFNDWIDGTVPERPMAVKDIEFLIVYKAFR